MCLLRDSVTGISRWSAVPIAEQSRQRVCSKYTDINHQINEKVVEETKTRLMNEVLQVDYKKHVIKNIDSYAHGTRELNKEMLGDVAKRIGGTLKSPPLDGRDVSRCFGDVISSPTMTWTLVQLYSKSLKRGCQ